MLSTDAVRLFLDDREASNCRPATIVFYRDQLARLIAASAQLPLDPAVLRTVLSSVKGRESSRACTFRALRALYRWLLSQHLIDENPMSLVRSPKVLKVRPRILDRPDVRDLLGVEISPRDRAMVTLLLDCGIRSGELRTLRGQDLRDEYIEVTGKSGERRVPVHPETMAQLRALVGDPTEPVFRTVDGRPLTRNRAYLIIRRALELAGLDRTTKRGPHLLRHSMATDWVRQGGSLAGLQELLGHANVTTTMIYVSLAQKDVTEEHARIGIFATPGGERAGQASPARSRLRVV